jgi:predicted nuclease of predicted toxin-antitoxin system
MAKFLANENVPGAAVEAVRRAGVDITWVRDISPGIRDDTVLTLSQAEGRVLLTFDKDFGEMAFEQGKTATPGVILLRPRLRSPEQVAQFTVALLSQPIDWTGNFCVAQEGRLRVVPMPD